MSNSIPNNVIVTEDTANKVIVNQDAPNQVVVRLSAVQGSSRYTKRYIHTQPVAQEIWTITHDLGGRPSVTIVDTAGTMVIGEVTYISDTQVIVEFTAAFSGFAYLT